MDTTKEEKWLHGKMPYLMRQLIPEPVSERKLRLFACASVRLVWDLLTDERSRHAVSIAEDMADQSLRPGQLANARVSAMHAFERERGGTVEMTQSYIDLAGNPNASPRECALYAAEQTLHPNASKAILAADNAAWALAGSRTGERYSRARNKECDLLRCIFGNPFRKPILRSEWREWQGGLVMEMARSIYQERNFDDLPILADILEEAGCDQEAILEHCREETVHAKGCWVIDLFLGNQ